MVCRVRRFRKVDWRRQTYQQEKQPQTLLLHCAQREDDKKISYTAKMVQAVTRAHWAQVRSCDSTPRAPHPGDRRPAMPGIGRQAVRATVRWEQLLARISRGPALLFRLAKLN